MKPKVFVVLPTYNEKENIEILIPRLLSLKMKANVIVVDDNSPDGTGDVAERIAKKRKGRVIVIHRAKKMGLGSAYIEGFRKAIKLSSDIVITMDSDLSHDPKVIPDMVKKLENSDIAIGSRYVSGGKIVGFNWWRTFLSSTGQLVAGNILRIPVKDSTSGYRAYRNSAVKALMSMDIKSQGYSFLMEAIYRLSREGFRISEVPIIFKVRNFGKSKLSNKEIYKAFETAFRLKLTGL